MSRVGKAPIPIPAKVSVTIDGQQVTVKGPKGELTREIHPAVSAAVEGGELLVTRHTDQKKHRALHGLTRALLRNMVVGVSEGYKRVLEIVGVGYRAEMKGKILVLNLGHSHPILLRPPDGIAIDAPPKTNQIMVEGIDKQVVGEVAAKIRGFRKPEPYKGKGIRYQGEHVRSKAGKTAGAGA
ncbi:MAG: 50S ribosomal protein L6 [bacterium]